MFAGEVDTKLIIDDQGCHLTGTITPNIIKQLYRAGKLKFEIQYDNTNKTTEIVKLIDKNC